MDINSFPWLDAITDAGYGDFGEMIRLLRSDALIPDEIERKLRMTLARMLAGDFKRRGRRPKLKCIPEMRPVLEKVYAAQRAFVLLTWVDEVRDELGTSGKPSTLKAALSHIAKLKHRSFATVESAYKVAKREYRAVYKRGWEKIAD